jgi:NAD(P)-dependent dehydrogenase (short-subunit alcohol dehydrogenase family)
MVSIKLVRESNSKLGSYQSSLVAVFVGGTSGIGESTLKKYAALATNPTIYVIGRNETAATRILEELKTLNPEGKYSFIKSDVTLVESVDAVCKEIKSKEKKLNLLWLSPGYSNLGKMNREFNDF